MVESMDDANARAACVRCGESTAVGAPLFSDRRRVPDGSYLCGPCQARLAATKGRRRLTDEEVRQLVDNASMAGITWGNNHI